VRLRGARRGPPHRRGDSPARFPDRAGRRLPARDGDRHGQPPGGRPLRVPEPHDSAALMAVSLSREAFGYETAAPATRCSRAWRRFALNPGALTGMLILLLVASAAIAAPWVAPHDPAKQSLLRRFTPPMWQAKGNTAYPLGTDQVGRDVLSRLIHG